MSEQEIRFRVVLDDSGVPAASARAEAGIRGVGRAVSDSSGAMLQFGKHGETTARQLQALSYQTSDIVTQLAGGQNPLLILLQQGGQLRDQFGGVGNVFRAVGQVMTVGRVAAFGLAGGLAAAAFAAFQGHEETDKLTKSLALNGDAAGRTRGQIEGMIAALATAPGATAGVARDALTALAGTGAFIGETMAVAGRAVVALRRLSGQSTEDIVKDFAAMRGGVAQWAAAHNQAYNYLTAEQFRYIRSLEAQGRVQDAMRANLEALASAMQARAAPAVGALERAFDAARRAGGEFWDWLKSIGRDEAPEQAIDRIKMKLAEIDRYLQARGGTANPQAAVARERLAAELAYAQEDARRTQRSVENKAAVNAATQREIVQSSRAFADASLGVDSAAEAKRLAVAVQGAEERRRVADADYRRREISAQQYTDTIIATERDRVAAEVRAAEQAVAIANRRTVEKPEDNLAKRQAVLAAETQLVNVLGKRQALEARVAADQFRVAPDAGVASAQEAFRAAELAAGQQQAQQFAEQLQRRREAATELVQVNRAAGVQLIQDARQRGEAEIALEEETWRRRLDLAARSAEDRRGIEEQLARWRAQRERKLNQELETASQRRARELFSPQQQRDFTEGFVDAGRAGFSAWLVDGRSAADALASYIKAKFAEMFATRFLDGPLQQLGSLVFSGFGSLFGGVFHQGGVVGAGGVGRSVPALAFAGAQRYHRGGLAGDEVPAILQRGEEVLRRDDPRHRYNGSAARGAAVTVQQTIHIGAGVNRNEVLAAMAITKQQTLMAVSEAQRRSYGRATA